MAKGSRFEQLDAAIQAMLKTPGGGVPKVSADLSLLVEVADELRGLPSETFKKNLKIKLERTSSMATAVEPMAATHTVALPRIAYKDTAKAIEFYKEAFGAEETMRFEIGGSIPHAEIRIGDSVLTLCDEWPEGGRFSAETLGQSPISISVQVPDVDQFSANAVTAGLKVINPPRDQFYGRREGNFVDPFGYSWAIYTVKEEMSVEEMHRRMGAQEPPKESPQKPAVDPVPKGFRMVTPYLVAEDGPALLEFTKQAFGAEELFRTIGGSGGLHAEAKIGDSMLMIGGGIPGREFRSTPNTHALHAYVKDADAVYQKALDAGAKSIGEPRDQDYGERSATVKDPAGNLWYIATHKGQSYLPKGLNNVNAYLHPLRAEPMISFLKRAFGARELAKYATPDGVVMHAEIQVGDSVVEMGEAHGPYQPNPSMFYLYVTDCDMLYRRALAAGATSISEPTDQYYGDRTAAVKDAFGNQWYIATHIKDVDM